MTRKEREVVGACIEALTHYGNLAQCQTALLRALREFTGAHIAHVLNNERLFRDGQVVQCAVGSPDLVPLFTRLQAQYATKMPIMEKVAEMMQQGTSAPPVGHIHKFLGEARWRGSEFFAEVSRHTEFEDVLAMSDKNSKGLCRWGLALGGGRLKSGRTIFNRRAIETLAWLNPYIARGLENLEDWHARQIGLGALAEQTGEVLTLVRQAAGAGNNELLLATGAAAKLLGLHARPCASNLHLQDFLRVCTRACGPAAGTVTWQAANGRSYALSALYVPEAGERVLAVRCLACAPAPVVADNFRFAIATGLSPREISVMNLLAGGLSNKEIAHRLFISVHTVHSHVAKIYRKLGVYGRIEAINCLRKQNQPEK
jgi:DNA-binding CsgD family transcriptional regulator